MKKSSEMSVLVVDDEQDILDLLRVLLSAQGFDPSKVTLASDGDEAATTIEQRTFDLLITDCEIGKYRGPDLMWQARKKSEDTKIVLMTADSGNFLKHIQTLSLIGKYGRLNKPFPIAELSNVLSAQGIDCGAMQFTQAD